jgi:hypothetical protein
VSEGGLTIIDVATKKPVRVLTGGTAGPYLMASVEQLDEIRRILDARGIRYWVEENFVSINGGPEIGVLNLGRGADAAAIQAILDEDR